MARRFPWRAILVIAILGALGAVLHAQPWRGRPSGGPAVTTVAVDRGAITAQVTATGTLSPRALVTVSSQVSGRVAEVRVDYDDRVTRGQVLAVIDRELLAAQLGSARASLEVARANLRRAEVTRDDARRTAARQQGLAEQRLVAAADADAAESKRAAAEAEVAASAAQVAQARAAVEQAATNLRAATITSPVDGVVISREIDVGQAVAASFQAPTLFTIAEDLGRMQIDTSVAESDVGRITPGMAVRFTVDAFPEQAFTGQVRQVRNAATTVQGVVTYDAVIDVANPGGLRPGMTANVTFVVAEQPDVVRIPNAALRFRPDPAQLAALLGPPPKGAAMPGGPPRDAPRRPGEKLVWKLVDGAPRPVPITVGLSDGTRTAVTGGDLASGDRLVTEMLGGKAGIKLPGAF